MMNLRVMPDGQTHARFQIRTRPFVVWGMLIFLPGHVKRVRARQADPEPDSEH
jgi:hypothetical protein